MGWASTRRWSGHRLLDSLANTLLDLGLPRIRAWLEQRFGPEVEVARVRVEGSEVILEDARLPLAGSAVLHIDEARARIGAGASKLRLLRLRGKIHVDANPGFTAPVEFVDEPGQAEQWVHGRLLVRDANWTATHGEQDQAPLSGEVFVRLSSQAWSLREGQFTCAASQIQLAAKGTMQDGAQMPVREASLGFTRARAGHLFDAVLALAGQDWELTRALPWTALLDGEARFDAVAGLHADLRAELGQGHELHLEGRLALDGALSQVGLRGAFDPRVVPLLEPWTGVFAAQTPLEVCVEGTVEGSLEEPRWRVRLELPSLELDALAEHGLRDICIQGEGGLHEASGHATASGPAGSRIQAFAGWDPANTPCGSANLRLERDSSALAIEAGFDAEFKLDVKTTGRVELVDLVALMPRLAGHFATPAGIDLEGTLTGPAKAPHLELRGGVDRFRTRDCQIDLCDAQLVLVGELGEGGFTGRLGLDTNSTQLALDPLRIGAQGQLEGSVLHGRLSSQDLQSFVRIEQPVELLADAHAVGRLELEGTLSAPVLDGEVGAEAIALRLPAGEGRVKVIAVEPSGHIRVEPTRFLYDTIAFRWAGSRLRASGELPYSGERGAKPAAVLEILEGHPALVATLACIVAGRRVATVEGRGRASWYVPAGLRTLGVIEAHNDGAVEAKLGFETEDSTLVATIGLVDGALSGTAKGRLATAEFARIGVLDKLPIAVEPQGHLQVEAELEGTSAAPQVRATIDAKTPMVRLGGECFVIDALRAGVVADPSCLRVEHLHATRGGGELDASGEWRLDRSRAQAKLHWRKLEVDDLPLDAEGKTRVRRYVKGRSDGQLDLHWVGTGLEGLSGQGRVDLDQASYPFLYAFQTTLKRLGLPDPRIAGTGPAQVKLSFDGRHLRLMDIRGAVRGCAIEGEVRIGRTGGLDGALHATVPASYLKRSPLLVFPASLTGDLRVPVSVGGSVDRPRFEPDVMATVGNMFNRGSDRSAKSRVDAWFERAQAAETPDDLRRKAKQSATRGAPKPRAEADAQDPKSQDELIREMMAAGVGLDMIERILERRRRAKPPKK